MDEITKREDALFGHISKLIDEAHKHVKTTVNTTMVYTLLCRDEEQSVELSSAHDAHAESGWPCCRGTAGQRSL